MSSFRRHKSPKVRVDGITLDILYTPQPVLYDPIPEKERSKFTLFRGFNLGKLACNILQDRPVLNAGKDNLISFSTYFRARWAAQNVIEGCGDTFQFTPSDREFIEDKTGLTLPTRMSAMIVALDPDVQPGPLVDMERYDHETPLRELEPTCRTAIKELFALPEELVS